MRLDKPRILDAAFVFVFDPCEELREKQFIFEKELAERYKGKSVQNNTFGMPSVNAPFFMLKDSSHDKQAMFSTSLVQATIDFRDQQTPIDQCFSLIEKDAIALKKALKKHTDKIKFLHSGLLITISYSTEDSLEKLAEFVSAGLIKPEYTSNILSCNVILGYDLKNGYYCNYTFQPMEEISIVTESLVEFQKIISQVPVAGSSPIGKKSFAIKLDVNDRGVKTYGKNLKEPQEIVEETKRLMKAEISKFFPSLEGRGE